jgi:bifunctional non-homologous end joining protein LigD
MFGGSAVMGTRKAFADIMTADSPNRFVATAAKSKRKGKSLIDYLPNGRGSTAVAPYSTRPRPGAAISMPLEWDELSLAIGRLISRSPTHIPGWPQIRGGSFGTRLHPLADGKG